MKFEAFLWENCEIVKIRRSQLSEIALNQRIRVEVILCISYTNKRNYNFLAPVYQFDENVNSWKRGTHEFQLSHHEI